MDLGIKTTVSGDAQSEPIFAKVDDRDDVGEIINRGINMGGPSGRHVYCVQLLFPTGEVAHYASDRVTQVDTADS